MNSYSKKHAIFLAAMLSATAVSMSPASAASNLMELLFGHRSIESRPVDQTRQVHPGRLEDDQSVKRASVHRPAAPIKRVVVTAPTNYDYKPEGLVQVDFSKVDTQITASADHGKDISPSMAMDEFGLKIDHLKAAHVLAEKEISDAIVSYYATKQRPIWTASYDVTRQAKAVVALFAKAADDGLDPQDYAVTVPSDDYDRANIPARLKQLADFELSMSARALRYAMDQGEGRINPNRLSGFHDFATGRVKPREVIDQLASSSDPSATLVAFEPQNKWYAELKQSLHE
ncbi:MAG TPA: peptidoglycan-binding protein, partial [Phyllobacterium sp.]|nr:peptidoglycan-binding protein [Phyllobacterium sp.]